MKRRLHFWLVTMTLVLLGQFPMHVCAQNPQTIEVGPHFGATAYIGELNTWRNLDQWQWKSFNQFHYDWGAVVRFNYDSRWTFRLDYTHATLRACDTAAAWRPDALLNFRTKLDDLSLIAEFNFLNYYTGRIESSISPYIFAGISGFMYSTYANVQDPALDSLVGDFPLQQLGTDQSPLKIEKKNWGLSIPFGVGCKFSLSQHLAATVEWRMHYTFTDYLDDVSGNYPSQHSMLVSTPEGLEMVKSDPDPENLLNHNWTLVYDFADPSGQFSERQQRGYFQTNDWFGMINFSLTWKFVIPNSSACKMNFE